jgi:uncharacterized DUF497 family protein
MTTAHFEWDSIKDHENLQKHGVSFASAQYAFADPHRIIAEDVNHSDDECVTTALASAMTEFSQYALLIEIT